MLAAVMAGFGGVISEVGASMMVGGNIKGQTRVAHHRHRARDGQGQLRRRHRAVGDPARLTFLVNWALTWIQQRRRV